ncbi:HU family DNA-binding protein, partial [Streptomyces sp. NPDC057052]|uniref:HU family DNA-binding protein n=1 Tax=Streptomyces sp. NPDC057052 TaxID=3346010 RepID=UPI0036382231
MNKAQLVEAIADKLGGRQQAADAVDAVLDAIVRATVAGRVKTSPWSSRTRPWTAGPAASARSAAQASAVADRSTASTWWPRAAR